MTTRGPRDAGLTLIELLVSTTILMIILSAISSAYVAFLSTAAETSGRDDHSGGMAVLASYLDRDLSSATSYSTSGTACLAAGTTLRLRLSWTEKTATAAAPAPVDAGTYLVTYSTAPDPDTPVGGPQRYRLIRSQCAPSATQVDRTVVSAMGSDLVQVVATPNCNGSPSTRLDVTVPGYSTDTSAPYRFVGCVGGRLA